MKFLCMIEKVEQVDIQFGQVVDDARITLRIIKNTITPQFTQELRDICGKYIVIDSKDFESRDYTTGELTTGELTKKD